MKVHFQMARQIGREMRKGFVVERCDGGCLPALKGFEVFGGRELFRWLCDIGSQNRVRQDTSARKQDLRQGRT